MIKILGYGLGNVRAISAIYEDLNIPCSIASTADDLVDATQLVLPGVGAFDEAVRLLNASGMRGSLDELVLDAGIPVLGICVGMQIMATRSEEGCAAGLDWISGTVRRIDSARLGKPKLPHMGWNSIVRTQPTPLLVDTDIEQGFYFLHSYHYVCNSSADVTATTQYGDVLACSIQHDNIYGLQFHPEKSHSNGIAVFRNFAQL